MRAEAVVERLSPEQEARRVEELKQREAERNERLRRAARERIREAQAELDRLEGKVVLNRAPITAVRKLVDYARDLRARFNRATTFNFLKASGVAAAFVLGGVFDVTCYAPDGSIRWVDNCVVNGITTQGMNHMLDVTFHGSTQKATWYLGLINNSPTPTLAVGDTYASHAGWTELTAFSQTLRVVWDEGAASSSSTTNAVTSDFSMNATNTVYGLALFSVTTKGDTATSGGVLFATAAFSGGNQGVSNGDTLKVTYTITGTPT